MRQLRWLELIKNYDVTINYHPGKANVVADALSWKIHVASLSLTKQRKIIEDLEGLEVEVVNHEHGSMITSLIAQPALIDRIKEAQKGDGKLRKIMEGVGKGLYPKF